MTAAVTEIKTYVSLPRLMIAGVRPQDGQNTVYRAVLAALIRRRKAVQTWIAGPDSTLSILHNQISGGTARTLDSWLFSSEMLHYLLQRHGGSPRISLIQAPQGLFDGLTDGYARVPCGSAADLSEELDVPVLLVLNGRTLSFADIPLLQGVTAFLTPGRIVGLIIASVEAEAYEQWYPLLSEATGIPCLGFLPPSETKRTAAGGKARLSPDQQLIWEALARIEAFDQETTRLADLAEQRVDLETVIRLAIAADPVPMSAPPAFMKLMAGMANEQPYRLGVARDIGFHDYSQNNLDLLIDMGAQVLPFSPLRDRLLPPDLDGLYFGGGHPEMVAAELAANAPLRTRICRAVERGVPLLAEAEGIFYLAQQLEDIHGHFHSMLGLIPGKGVLSRHADRLGYCELTSLTGGLLGPPRRSIRAVTGNRLKLTETGQAFRVRSRDQAMYTDGFMSPTVCATRAKLFFHNHPDFAAAFSRACSAHALSRLNGEISSLEIWPL